MRITSERAAMRLATTVAIAATAIAAGACSSSDRFPGPSWNLTGGKSATPLPPRPIYQEPPQRQAALPPAPEPPTIIYRGGRDPITGRAATFGAPPAGLQRQPAQATPAIPPVPAAPATKPLAPTTSLQGQTPTVEVRPGQSLAMIAAEQRVSIASLMSANRLTDAYVIPGQVLVVPRR